MRRRNNNILTPTERVFYIRRSIEEIHKVIDECSKVINNPETDEEKRMMALDLLSDANVELEVGLKALEKVKEQKAAADS
jgi:hypothetical protein